MSRWWRIYHKSHSDSTLSLPESSSSSSSSIQVQWVHSWEDQIQKGASLPPRTIWLPESLRSITQFQETRKPRRKVKGWIWTQWVACAILVWGFLGQLWSQCARTWIWWVSGVLFWAGYFCLMGTVCCDWWGSKIRQYVERWQYRRWGNQIQWVFGEQVKINSLWEGVPGR
jgi:hypothetical protein